MAMITVTCVTTIVNVLVALCFSMLVPASEVNPKYGYIGNFGALGEILVYTDELWTDAFSVYTKWRQYYAFAWSFAGVHYMTYVVATAGLLGSITGLVVFLFSSSRLVMVVSREWMLPPFLAKISPRHQTPAIAQITVGIIVGKGWM